MECGRSIHGLGFSCLGKLGMVSMALMDFMAFIDFMAITFIAFMAFMACTGFMAFIACRAFMAFTGSHHGLHGQLATLVGPLAMAWKEEMAGTH